MIAFYSDIGRESHAPVIHSFGGGERMETLLGRTQRKSIIKATLGTLSVLKKEALRLLAHSQVHRPNERARLDEVLGGKCDG
jgi:hypothetical protein